MFYNAKNGNMTIDGTDMDYITFGQGAETVVMIPGLGDGLKTVKGMALPMAYYYRAFAKKYKVYVLSRKNKLPEGYTTKDMAKDVAVAMAGLGISKAYVMGISQGGMIAQHLTVDYPALVEKLVLVVTMARQNETVQRVIGEWNELAKAEDMKSLFADISEKSYTEKRRKLYRPFYGFISKVAKPKSFDNYKVQANACLTHDAYDAIESIACPTFIIGGAQDKIVGTDAATELAEKIKGSQLYVYENYGHGLYDETKDFNGRVLQFLAK